MTSSIAVYCSQWHLETSPSMQLLLVEPLRPWLDLHVTAWPPARDVDLSRPLVFHQLHPPAELLARPEAKLIWLPMWDDVRIYAPGWWRTLPRTLRIVAFSRRVRELAEGAGLQVFDAQYFPDPAKLPTASWEPAHGRVLHYWNRTGLIGPDLLARLCAELNVRKLIFGAHVDPNPALPADTAYSLPARLGRTEVFTYAKFLPREEHEALLRETNLYIAPRLHEGVGVAFLDAMARGCGLLAHDTPTMNEYIRSGQNGWLFPSILPAPWRERLHNGLRRRLPALVPPLRTRRQLAANQSWAALRALDWPALGRRARENHLTGYARWQSCLANYARFIAEWN